jgi:HEAT repeat protein
MNVDSNFDPFKQLKWKRETDRLAAINKIATRCSLRAVEALTEISKSGSCANERRAASVALAEWGEHESWEMLARLFRSGSERTQVFALDALSKRSDPQMAMLIDEAAASRHLLVRLSAMKVFELWSPHNAIQRLLDYLSDPSGKVRATAIDLLVRRKCPELHAYLPKLVHDNDALVRASAVSAVALMYAEIAHEIGILALQDYDTDVRLAAVRALA